MKNVGRVFAGVLILAGLGGNALYAQDEPAVSVSFDMGIVNQYLWRGFQLNKSTSVQPGISIGYKEFTFSTWSNSSSIGPNGKHWTEHDVTLDYTKGFGKNSLSLGYINYGFPDVNGSSRYTSEFYAGYAYDTILSPSLTVYRDVDDGNGWYYYASVGHSFSLPKNLSLNPSAGMGVNQHQWISQTAVSNIDLSVSLDIPVGHVTLSPFFGRHIGPTTLTDSKSMWGVMISVSN